MKKRPINNAMFFPRTLTCLTLSVLLVGCGFHARTTAIYPESLKTIYLASAPSNDPYFPVYLRQYITSMGATITDNAKAAPYILTLDSVKFSNSSTTLSAGETAMSVTYTLAFQLHLKDQKDNDLVPPLSMSVRRSLLQNSPQVNTLANSDLVLRELTRDGVSRVSDWLSAESLNKTLLTPSKSA